MSPTGWTPPAPGSLAGRTCLVTGATGGMGRVITTGLARAGATVVAVCRDPDRGAALRRDVADAVGADRVEVLTGDLGRQADVRDVARRFLDSHDRLHVLVNNAGAHFRDQRPGPDGVEQHLAVNHLGPFLLTELLLPALRAAAPARIVNVLSDALADTRSVKIRRRPRPATIDPDRLGQVDDAGPMAVYGRSKLAGLLCGYLLADRLDGSGVTVNALHPGLVSTGIVEAVSPALMAPLLPVVRRFLLTAEQGAEPALRLATDPALAGVTGRYFRRHQQVRTPPESYDTHLQQQVRSASSRLVGIADPAGAERADDSPPARR
jgi:NAD(P)-dependent dehydrogenase (short-subunit alcohol dehydrogenase family)